MRSYTITDDYKIYQIEVLMGWGEGRLFSNAYVVQSGEALVLVDTGCSAPGTWDVFHKAMDDLGYGLSRLEKIIITHGHVDHYGLAKRLSEASEAKVYIHKNDLYKISGGHDFKKNFFQRLKEFMGENGMVEEEVEETCATMNYFSSYAEQVPLHACETVEDGDVIPVGKSALKVLHCPGHSPGHICLYDEKNHLLFTGDHLLPDRVPNPVFEPTWGGRKRKEIWRQFLSSLENIKKIQINVVFPGHGRPFRDVLAVVNHGLSYFKGLKKRVLEVMGGREIHPAGIAREIDSKLKGIPLFLKVMDVLGVLEALEEGGHVQSRFERGRLVFRRAGLRE